MEIQTFFDKISGHSLAALEVNNMTWFRAKNVAIALGYKDPQRAISDHVDDEDKTPLEELKGGESRLHLKYHEKTSLYINESGLYSLIFSSQLPSAKQFKRWVTSEVMPAIRKTGRYEITPVYPQIKIMNEHDLHTKVIDFARTYLHDAIIMPTLGELQSTSYIRHDAYLKGYTGGAPDILILNRHKYYTGLAIEFKTPTGKGRLSDKQEVCLDMLKSNGYRTIVSNNYDQILYELMNYFRDILYACRYCHYKKYYRTVDSLKKHYEYFHKIKNI